MLFDFFLLNYIMTYYIILMKELIYYKYKKIMIESKEYTEIINIIENQRWDKLKYILSNMHAAEVVDIIRILDNDKNRSIVFRLLSREMSAYVFSELEIEEQEKNF